MSKRLRCNLKNCIINPDDKPLMTIFQLSYDIDTFLRSKQYSKSVLKQTYWDYYDIIWSRMHDSILAITDHEVQETQFYKETLSRLYAKQLKGESTGKSWN